jgi:PAS domain S-box-containing protein
MKDRRPAGVRSGAPKGIIALVIVILSILGTGGARADGHKRVLIIHSGDNTRPAAVLTEAAVRQALQSRIPDGLNIFSEYLDAYRFPGTQHADQTAALLRGKYAGYPIDLIITVGPEALDLVLDRRGVLFANVPLVFTEISQETLGTLTLPAGVAGIVSRWDFAPTLELALRLQPDARHLAVVTGSSPRDMIWEERARAKLRPYEERLHVEYLSRLRMPELLEQARHLPSDAIILYIGVLQDAAGDTFAPRDVAEKLSTTANAPIYSIFMNYLGHGVVGGNMDAYETLGKQAADLGFELMSGRQVETVSVASSGNFVDWRQLQRWGLEKSRLPPDALLRFKEPSLWQRRRWQIIGIFALFIAQSALITALLVQARRRLHAERKALESEERMNLATTSANLGLWHWDVVSKRLWTSEICRRIVGLAPKADVTLQKFLGLIHREDLAVSQQSAGEPVTTRRLDQEHQLDAPGGANRWIRTVGRTKYDPSGRPVWMTGVIIDVTQEKTAERELAHWRQELMHTTRVATLGALSGAMAHELNQPLTAILGNANAAHIHLGRKDYDIEEMREIVAEIETEATRAGDIIRHLRALFAKAETQFQPVGANQIIGEVLKLVHSDLVARKINVTFRPAPDLPSVQGDRVQLQQVLLNLIFNACDAMANIEPGRRDLTLVTAPESTDAVLISVSDQGGGVKADMLDRLFRPFVTTKTRGLGLGLSICRSIVESHGGQLWATNNPKGGATFCLALPANGATAQ